MNNANPVPTIGSAASKEKKVFLKFKDKSGNTKFVVRENDTQPLDADKLVLQDVQGSSEEKETTEPSKEATK